MLKKATKLQIIKKVESKTLLELNSITSLIIKLSAKTNNGESIPYRTSNMTNIM